MTTLTEFSYQNADIRVFGTKLEPWFVLVDVLEILGVHRNNISRVVERLDEDEKGVVKLTTPGGVQDAWIISEPGLYKIMLRSRTPAAESFTRFVTHEVLPQIRKTGKYIPPQPKRGRGRLKKTYEIASGEKLFLQDLRVRCAMYEDVYVNKSAYKKASAEDCVAYINQKITEGAKIRYSMAPQRDETYWIVVDGKRIEIPR